MNSLRWYGLMMTVFLTFLALICIGRYGAQYFYGMRRGMSVHVFLIAGSYLGSLWISALAMWVVPVVSPYLPPGLASLLIPGTVVWAVSVTLGFGALCTLLAQIGWRGKWEQR